MNIDQIAGDLERGGLALVENALPASLLAQLVDDCSNRALPFGHAGMGRGKTHLHDSAIRGDMIRWLDDAREADHRYLTVMRDLGKALNEQLYLGLFHYEGHYATYAVGAHYDKHVDALAGQRNRLLSTVVYLNDVWTAANGGELVLYNHEQRQIARVLPQPGLLVLFLSEDFPHEVLVATKPRHSIAGWFRSRVST